MSDKQAKIYVTVICICIIHIVLGMVALTKWNSGTFNTKIPNYTGIVTNKELETYACGKHNRRTCTYYYLMLDGKPLNVTSDIFFSTIKGQKYTHYITRDDTPKIVNYFIFSILPAFALMFLLALFTLPDL